MIATLRSCLLAAALACVVPAAAIAGQQFYAVTGKISGEYGPARAITADDLSAIGTAEITTKVITLGEAPRRVKGVLARDLMHFLGATGTTLKIVALDGYAIEVPVADITNYDVLIATEIDGKALSVRDKGPAWLIYPVSAHKELDDTIYEARSVWQIKTIEFD